ncbi:MAG: PQQ-binding-like beta-propeller repeat protein, partial [Planctomycetia bacterium]
MTIVFSILLSVLTAAVPGESARDAHWPQWRGPQADGTAPTADPPLVWSEQQNVRWKVALPGRGSSSPIVWGDKVFVAAAAPTDKKGPSTDTPQGSKRFEKKTEASDVVHEFIVLCLDKNTGKELWRDLAAERVPHEGHHPSHSYCGGSPATDGERLYVSFGSSGTFCYDLDGKRLWKREFGLLNTRLGWGEAVTPVVAGDALLINWDQEADSKLVCLDAKTGATRWEVPRDEKSTWTTPLVVEVDGVLQVVMNGATRIRGYNLADGSVVWQCAGMTMNPIPSPVTDGETVYVVSGYKGAAARAVKLNAKGEVAAA